MQNIWTIARREYKAYFSSFTAYLFAFTILLVIGGIFAFSIWITLDSFGQFPPPGVDLVLYPLMFLLIFACPAFTMRLFSEENRLGTLELLMTAPVRDVELVLGKWLGSFLFVFSLVALTWIYPIALHTMTSPGIDQGPLVTGYLGVLLVCATFLAIGVAVSALFSNQVASYITTFMLVVFFWWVLGIFGQGSGAGGGNPLFQFLDLKSHFYDALIVGVFKLSSLTYYLSFTAFSLLLATVFIEARRWQ